MSIDKVNKVYIWTTDVNIKILNDSFRGTATLYRGADKSLARPTSRCILFDGENISFDASCFIYIYIYIYIYDYG